MKISERRGKKNEKEQKIFDRTAGSAIFHAVLALSKRPCRVVRRVSQVWLSFFNQHHTVEEWMLLLRRLTTHTYKYTYHSRSVTRARIGPVLLRNSSFDDKSTVSFFNTKARSSASFSYIKIFLYINTYGIRIYYTQQGSNEMTTARGRDSLPRHHHNHPPRTGNVTWVTAENELWILDTAYL